MTLIHIIIGALCISPIFLLHSYSKRKEVKIKSWQWTIIIIEMIYIGFVLELIAGFIEEGSGKAAIVMGSIFGTGAILGAVLIYRYILNFKSDSVKS